jgi:retron-type reverse transcriptase
MLSDRTKIKMVGLQKCIINGNKAKDLYKTMMTCEDLWMQAYINIQGNKGALTKSVDNSTVDGFNDEFVKNIIMELQSDKFRFKPTQRVYIPKKNGEKRPLGIPRFKDKLIQEICRILLEIIYEPQFSKNSHGFRPKKSCHTALNDIKKWSGTTWFLDFDIKGYFNNINHKIMIKLLEKKIDDKRFLKLIREMLQAGYLENWKYYNTYSGTPQGGVISPILANIYLNELDEYIEKIKFNKGKYRMANPEYQKISGKRNDIQAKIKRRREWIKVEEKQSGSGKVKLYENDLINIQTEIHTLIKEYNDLGNEMYEIPSKIHDDPNFKRMHYVRYADDFIIGIIGTKHDAEIIQRKTKEFLKNELNLETSEEKTGIKHAREEGIKFLSYNIQKTSNVKAKYKMLHGRNIKQRNSGVAIKLTVPTENVIEFSKKYGNIQSLEVADRTGWLSKSEIELVSDYNAEFRGFANYYALADDVKHKLHKLEWIVETSWLKTVADKLQISVNQVVKRYKHNNDFYVESGKSRIMFFKLKHLKSPKINETLDAIPFVGHKKTQLEDRINANICEYCGKIGGYYEIHHIKKLKDISKGKQDWQKCMIEKQRKTLVLCIECHHNLHNGILPDRRYLKKE